MSSVFGHRPGAIYEDRAYSFRERVPSIKILAAFVVGIGCAAAVAKAPALWSGSGETAPAATSPVKSAEPAKPADAKPSVAPAAAVATPPAAAESAPAPAFKREAKTRHVRVIAPDRVPPPANAALASSDPAPQETTGSSSADTNSGAAPRETMAAVQPEAVPMPPPRPAELPIASAPERAPAPAPSLHAAAPAPSAAPAIESASKPAQAAGGDSEAREAAAQKAKAAREAKRARLAKLAEKRARQARTLQAQNEADGFSLARSYTLPDGRRVTVYRRYDGEPGRALAFGGDYSRRLGPPPGSGLFSFFGDN